jgi:hypothetical protein
MSLPSKNINSIVTVQNAIILQYLEKWLNESIATIEQQKEEEKLVFAHLCAEKTAETPLFWKTFNQLVGTKKIANTLATLWQQSISTSSDLLLQHFTNNNYRFEPYYQQGEIEKPFFTNLQKVAHLPTFALVDIVHNDQIDFSLLQTLVGSRGDCLLYFDYKKIARSIHRKSQTSSLTRLFGEKGLTELRNYWKQKPKTALKEHFILQLFSTHLQEKLAIIAPPLSYRFCDDKGKTDTFFIFLTQQQHSYEWMRTLFNQNSQILEDGIGNFNFNAALQQTQTIQKSQTLFGAMFELEQLLLQTFQSQTLQIKDLYHNFHFGRIYTKQNYLDAIRNLDDKDQIAVRRKRNRFGYLPAITEHTFVSFNR